MSMTVYRLLLALCVMVVAVPARAAKQKVPAPPPARPMTHRDAVEADWLAQEKYRSRSTAKAKKKVKITPQMDAAGAVDGVRNGLWGFHTALQENPWWQVDLGKSQPLASVVIWNRCDRQEQVRASRLIVLLSDDGKKWRKVYQHDGTLFNGFPDKKPLEVNVEGLKARFVRIQLPGKTYLHLDEVDVYRQGVYSKSIALRRPATQSSVSGWSTAPPVFANVGAVGQVAWAKRVGQILANCRRLVDERRAAGVDVSADDEAAERLAAKVAGMAPKDIGQAVYFEARWIQRALTLSDPLLDFDSLLFVKRVPGRFSHMSDQYYGWWSRPGGGIFILRDFKGDKPAVECITDSFTDPGSFLRPMLSYDGRKVLFAWCRYHPKVSGEKNKLNKANVPEDAFYHLYEMNVDGSGVRQLTRGKYDDFDGRYLPDGRKLFLSTRRGQAVQVGSRSACETLAKNDLPDVYVRCGGGASRPVAVYTLHTIDADGGNLSAISPFEMFEWTPSIARDGTILYSRWDYVDRSNMPYMSLWAMNPDGTNARLVYGNFTRGPHCTFEPRSVPGSRKIIFTGSGHHAQTMGTLVLLDPAAGDEGAAPIVRLTPDVQFPEIEGWPKAFYANPWPLSEQVYLVAWGVEPNPRQGGTRKPTGMNLYVLDTAGGMELIYGDPKITSACPIPLRPRQRPPVVAAHTAPDGPQEGRFLLADVYRGLKTVKPGDIKALRIVTVPPKTQPTMNSPSIGLTRDDPGKCVLGTVPVEADGSAYFRVPAGVIVFFQALDARGMAVQTMRSATHVQPGQTLSCIGCHEPRSQAPLRASVLAARREPSKITVGPEGSWPLRFDRLVQPVLDRHCIRCHKADPAKAGVAKAKPPRGRRAKGKRAKPVEAKAPAVDKTKPDPSRFVLTADKAYVSLTRYGKVSLFAHVTKRYKIGASVEGACVAAKSAILAKITDPKGHHGVKLDAESLERLITWMDTYAQRSGSFSADQERRLEALRRRHAEMLIERETRHAASGPPVARPGPAE